MEVHCTDNDSCHCWAIASRCQALDSESPSFECLLCHSISVALGKPLDLSLSFLNYKMGIIVTCLACGTYYTCNNWLLLLMTENLISYKSGLLNAGKLGSLSRVRAISDI